MADTKRVQLTLPTRTIERLKVQAADMGYSWSTYAAIVLTQSVVQVERTQAAMQVATSDAISRLVRDSADETDS